MNVGKTHSRKRRSNSAAERDVRKQSLYFPEGMIADMLAEADRQDRSLSWVVQQAWKEAAKTIKKYPAAPK